MAAKKKESRRRSPSPKAKPAAMPSKPAAPHALAADEFGFEPKRGGAFPIVGIGGSAGGLDAFNKFFDAMPADSGCAFVLLPHLDPKHESLMVELLARHTKMEVIEAADGMTVAP